MRPGDQPRGTSPAASPAASVPAPASSPPPTPTPRTCKSRRSITIHVGLHVHRHVRLTHAVLQLDGKVVARLSTPPLDATIDLSGLKAGSFAVAIRATTAGGSVLKTTVHYRTRVPA